MGEALLGAGKDREDMLYAAILEQVKTRTIVAFHLAFFCCVLAAWRLNLNANFIVIGLPIAFYLGLACWLRRRFASCQVRIRDFIGGGPAKINWPKIIATTVLVWLALAGISGLELQLAKQLGLVATPGLLNRQTVALPAAWGVTFVLGVLIAPVIEEMLYRGVILHRLSRRWGVRGGVVASSLLFALMHFSLPLLSRFLLGVILANAFIKTRTLLVPIVMHATFNGLALAERWLVQNLAWQLPTIVLFALFGYAVFGAVVWLLYYLYKNRPTKDWRLPFDDAAASPDPAPGQEQNMSG
jgi:membrane protease YdiL (CAAX protease family)